MKKHMLYNKHFRRKMSPIERDIVENDGGDEDLPHWNLEDLYTGADSSELLADRMKAGRMVQKFQAAYETGVARLSGAELGEAIEGYEEIESLCSKIDSYILLLESEDRDNFSKTEPLKKWSAETKGRVAFFTREIGGMKEADLLTKLIAPELAQYAPWVARQRQRHEHSPPEKIEKISRSYKSTNTEAWKRLYFETLSDLRVEYEGKQLTFEELAAEAHAWDATLPERLAARAKMGEVLKQGSERLALVYNVLVKETVIDAGLKKYDRPDHGTHLENGLTPEVVDTMFDTVKASFGKLSHTFYAWKAKQRGSDVIKSIELMETPPQDKGLESPQYTWDEARRVVLRSFRKFHPRFGRIAQRFFDEEHIDAEPRPRKDSGAFTLAAGHGSLPYILVNYDGTVEDVVASLGHELGHGIHQVLIEKAQGLFLADMPVAVSEIASIYAETLIFEEIFRSEKDPKVKQGLLEERIEAMLGNALQQLSYYDFERRVHAERKNGELSAKKISDIWEATQKEYYGPAIELDEYDRYSWTQITHFFESPFYVYSYSFAQMAVNALYQEQKKADRQGPEALAEFTDKYITLLETGITKNSYEMFAPFGLDPEQPAFWESGLSLIDKYLGELTRLGDQKPRLKAKPSAPKPPASGL